MFSPDPPLSVRREVQLFIRGCEHLLSGLSSPDAQPLSEDERRLIDYYREELVKVIGAMKKK